MPAARIKAAAMIQMFMAQHNPLQLQMVPAQPGIITC
jgi:hypothetical protein